MGRLSAFLSEGSLCNRIILLVIAVVTACSSVAGLIWQVWPESKPTAESRPDIEVVAVDIDRLDRIDAVTVHSGPTPVRDRTQVEVPVIDILLHNAGTVPGYVTDIVLTLRTVSPDACRGIGGGEVTHVQYDIKVPSDATVGDIVHRAARYRIEPGKDGRIVLSIGAGWLSRFDVALQHGDNGPTTHIRDVAFTAIDATSEIPLLLEATEDLEPPADPADVNCYETLLKTWQELSEARHVPSRIINSTFASDLARLVDNAQGHER